MKDILDIVLVKEVVQPVLIIGVSIFIYVFINHLIKRMLKVRVRRVDYKKHQTILTVVRSVIKYIIFIIDVLLILSVYGVDTKAIIASLGVIGVVLGLGLQDLLKDVIAGGAILFENQYRVGDTVSINGFKGEVLSLGLKTTRLKAYTGEIKILSNRVVTEVINYSLDINMAIIDVSVDYDSDLDFVEGVLKEVCKEQQEILPNLKGSIDVLGIQELESSGIVYRITVPCVPMQHFGVERALRKAIKNAFDENHIVIPYPQVVMHDGI